MAKVLTTDNISSMLSAIRDYIDDKCEKLANGCSVSLTGNGVTLSTSNVVYLKPAVIELEADEGVSITTVTVVMGEDTLSSAYDDDTNSVIVSKVTDDIEITVSTTSLLAVTLDGVSLSNRTLKIGQAWNASFVNDTGKQLLPDSVVILMDSVDITSTAFDSSDNSISISEITGLVEITAQGVAVDAAYKPVNYIEVASRASGNALNTGYKPNMDTKLVMDVELKSGNTSMLYGNHYTNSSDTPHYYFMYQVTATSNFIIGYGEYNTGTVSTSAGRIKRDARIKFTCDKGAFSYPNASGGTRSINYSSNGGTFEESSTTLKLFGYSGTSSNGNAAGKIYRVTISENDVVLHDFIPCVKLEGSIAGLYDIINGTYVQADNYTAV